MSVWMAGVDHTKADLDVRSVFSFTNKRIAQAYEDLKGTEGLEGCILMSTCNRMEIWFSVSPIADFDPVELLCEYIGVSTEDYAPFFVVRKDREAVDHLFRVAAGMESRIVGEDQIITQVGDALAFARSCYATDHTLEVLFRLAVTAAKRVKTESSISSSDQSVIHTALRNLRDEGIELTGKKCMVIGNGMMGRVSAQALMDAGAEVTVTVREYHSGIVDIPMGADRIGYTKRFELLPDCDFVVSATTSPNYTITLEDLSPLTVDHKIMLIDLAVPRDIDPQCRSLEWITLYDIDAFHINPLSDKLVAAMEKAQGILDEEEERFYSWYEGKDLVPQIQRIKTVAGADVSARMTPILRRVRQEEERQRLSQEAAGASERMLNHLLYGMRSRLSEAAFRECLDAMEYATKDWLKERLGLDISPEKSKVINLKEDYSEFLGFKLKLIPRGKNSKGKTRYVVQSHVRDKSLEKIRQKLKVLIHAIEFPKNEVPDAYEEIGKYNSYVLGIHGYYSMATKASTDFRKLAFPVQKSLKARLRTRMKTAKEVKKNNILCHIANIIKEKYGKSQQLRYVQGIALAPIGYVRHRYPKQHKRGVNSYTPEGRAVIHKHLNGIDMKVLHYLMRHPVEHRSIEYNDNRLSLFSAQKGKCAVTGKVLEIGDIHCHHKVPLEKGGTDAYQNLILVCGDIHRLIHAKMPETIAKYMEKLSFTSKQKKKLETLRSLVNVESC